MDINRLWILILFVIILYLINIKPFIYSQTYKKTIFTFLKKNFIHENVVFILLQNTLYNLDESILLKYAN
jgi:4-hydroxybenzoate polyprenyltransferase